MKTHDCQHPNLTEKLGDMHQDIRTIMINQGVQQTEISWIKGGAKIVVTVLIPLIVSTIVALYRSY